MMLQGTPSSATPPGPVLRDIHLPPPPSWWPPAPGWWLLAALVVIMSCLAGWAWRRRRRRDSRHEAVLREVDRLEQDYLRDNDAAALASGLHQLLRRAARRLDAAAVRQRGEAWRQTLSLVPVDAATLDQLMLLEQAIYRRAPALEPAASIDSVRLWLRLALKAKQRILTEAGHA